MQEDTPSSQKCSDRVSPHEEAASPPAVDAVDRVQDGHSHYLGLAAAAAEANPDEIRHHASELRDILTEVETHADAMEAQHDS